MAYASWWVVRALLVLNILLALALVVLAALSFVFEPRILPRLTQDYGPDGARTALAAMRGVLLLVVPVAIAAHLIFVRLLAILRTVAAGDPFVAANGDRLRAIGWALLVIQLCDLLLGWLGFSVDAALGERVSGWTPGITGWLAVLLAFVLAQVFREGARMRDDLELTI